MSEFKTIPTVQQMAERIANIHMELRQLGQACGLEVAQLGRTLHDSTAITDQALEELALQIAFLMQTIRVVKPANGGIAGPDGKVPMEVKTASQIYQETGRAKLLEQIEAVKRAQGIPPAESPTEDSPFAGHGSPEESPASHATAAPSGPKTITH